MFGLLTIISARQTEVVLIFASLTSSDRLLVDWRLAQLQKKKDLQCDSRKLLKHNSIPFLTFTTKLTVQLATEGANSYFQLTAQDNVTIGVSRSNMRT